MTPKKIWDAYQEAELSYKIADAMLTEKNK